MDAKPARKWAMDSGFARICTLAAIALLLAGLIPRGSPEPLRSISSAARSVLHAVGVVSGITVFDGQQGHWKIHAECVEVLGQREGERPERLYRNPCPPRGFILAFHPFERMVQGLVRNVDVRQLLRAPRELPAQRRAVPDGPRRMILLGDYYCRSPLAGGPRDRVTVVRRQLQVHRLTGAVAERALTCRYACDADQVVVPHCTLGARPATHGAARPGG